MIEIKNIALQRGTKVLLNDASLSVNPNDKLALVGANGCGKSSLFGLLLNQLSVDAGDIFIPPDWRIVHMAQEVEASPKSALDYVLDGHIKLRELEQQLADCNDDLKSAEIYAELDEIRAWELPSLAERLLQGLGFTADQHQHPVADFSGGWRIRMNLARALLCPSDLLLLDEPTNHLDLDACLWLEQWLQQYKGTLLLVSHDRDFIDSVCDGVVHVERQQLNRYNGNYSAFERQRSERLAQQQQAYEKQQLEIAHMQKFVARFKAKASKAKQAQSRVKALARMGTIAAAHVDSPFSFSFPAPDRVSDPLLTIKHGELGYEAAVLNNVGLNIHPGSRIALLGANGQGKSTLVKSLAGDINLLNGERTEGAHLKIGYFSQHQLESLDLNASPITQLQRKRPKATEQDIRNFLGSFDFRGSAAEGGITHFSGGEKARLALALVVWQQPNLLLLDEPTNHLDLDMCHALTVALQAYEGAVVLISHDRHLVRNCADFLYLVNAGRVTEFKGDLDDYRKLLLNELTKPKGQADQSAKELANQNATDQDAGNQDANSPDKNGQDATSNEGAKIEAALDNKTRRRLAAEQREKLAPLTKRLKQIERKMAQDANKLEAIEGALTDVDLYTDAQKDKLAQLLSEQAELKQAAIKLDDEWFEVQTSLEEMTAS